MKTETKKALAALLNAHADNSHRGLFDELTALSNCAIDEGFINWVNGGYTIPDEKATVVPDLRTETLGLIVALFEAFQDRDDDMFEVRLANLGDYLRERGWIESTDSAGYAAPSINIPVIPLDAIKLITHVLNAWEGDTVLTLYDGMIDLTSCMVDTGLLSYSMRDGYSVPDAEPRIIPFVPKD